MTIDIQHDPKIASVIEKVRKLLAIANDERGNEHQAEAAAAKAQELLDAYNLDMAILGQADKGAREDKRLAGGLYKWQRSLWQEIASSNYCYYWFERGLTKGSKYEHRVVGRTVNVLSVRLMAEYLEGAIERITREEYCAGDHRSYFKKDAIAFREGMADRIVDRLRERRWKKEQEARRQQREQQERAAREGTGVALTILDVRQREREANDDFLMGEGYTARRKQRDAEWERERQERQRQAEEEAERFMRENPEEYARQQAEEKAAEEKARKREERNARRRKGRTYREPKPRHESFYEGQRAGNDVSLDPQVEKGSTRKQIGG